MAAATALLVPLAIMEEFSGMGWQFDKNWITVRKRGGNHGAAEMKAQSTGITRMVTNSPERMITLDAVLSAKVNKPITCKWGEEIRGQCKNSAVQLA